MRHAFKLKIRPGTELEYERRHREVYPELLQVFHDAGVRTYSIFRDGLTLFAYMEMDDPEETMRIISSSEINAQWQTYMSDILAPFRSGNAMEILPEVFHCES